MISGILPHKAKESVSHVTANPHEHEAPLVQEQTSPVLPHKHIDYESHMHATDSGGNKIIKFLDTEQAKLEIKLILHETGETLSADAIDALAKWKVGARSV